MTRGNPRPAALPAVAAALLAAACQTTDVVPRPDKLAPWNRALSEAQPDDSFMAIYTQHRRALVVIGAKHSLRSDSLAFRLIEGAYAAFDFDTVIVEGPRYSAGPNAERLMAWIDRQSEVDGLVQAGEIVPAVRGARQVGADVWGGEPDDAAILERLSKQGIDERDALGFYTLRSVPQWLREKRISDAADARLPALIELELDKNRERLALPAALLPDYDAWARWYEETNEKVFSADFQLEETGPRADGLYGTNRIAVGISRARDEFLLEVVARHWNAGETVMLVFGRSHLMILKPALDAMLGAPCYVGDNYGLIALGHCH